MKVRYFPDTDTAYIEFTGNKIIETRDVNEDILIDIDEDGGLVGMTVEHAKSKASISEFSYQEIVEKIA